MNDPVAFVKDDFYWHRSGNLKHFFYSISVICKNSSIIGHRRSRKGTQTSHKSYKPIYHIRFDANEDMFIGDIALPPARTSPLEEDLAES